MAGKDSHHDDIEDEEDNLSVPAGAIRVVIGLIVMTVSILAAGLSDNRWVKVTGLILFLLSAFIMLKRPDKETDK